MKKGLLVLLLVLQCGWVAAQAAGITHRLRGVELSNKQQDAQIKQLKEELKKLRESDEMNLAIKLNQADTNRVQNRAVREDREYNFP
jgi:hypothetical protein